MVALTTSAACGSSDGDPDDELLELFSGELAEAPQDRTVVAEVDGVPVYDDCVRTQAEAHSLSVDDALTECIDFELLAAEARRRGMAPLEVDVDREVVRSFIDREFAARFADPHALPQEKLRERYAETHRPEYRFVTHALAILPRVADDDPREVHLRELMAGLAQRLAGRTNVTRQELVAEARRASDQLKVEQFDFPRHNRAVEEFAAPVFAMSRDEVGTTIGPIRTQYGWHVILLEKIEPEQTYDEWLDATVGELRRRAFETWVSDLAAGRDIEVDETVLPALATRETGEPGGAAP